MNDFGHSYVSTGTGTFPSQIKCLTTNHYSSIFIFINTIYSLNNGARQIKICAEYRDMLPRPRLVCQEPGLRPIGQVPGEPGKSSRDLSLFYSIRFPFLLLCGFGWELCRTATMQMHSALCHCILLSEWGWSSDNQSSQHALLWCNWPM